MKVYCADYNGVLTDLRTKLHGHLVGPREADVFIVWQDCQGSYADLISTMKKLGINKPVYVVQHGRGSTHDYGPPHSWPLSADKFLCWGKADYDRMVRLGYKDRVEIVGCPLNAHIKPPVPHKEKVALFIPVNTGKEEPENIAAYYELMKLKYKKAQFKVLEMKDALKDEWDINKQGKVPFNALAEDFDVIAKLLPWHDKALYHGNTLSGYQDHPSNNFTVFNLLRNVDVVVGLDEGTTEIFAYGHNVPVVIAEGFKYRQYKPNGRDFVLVDAHRTKASMRVPLSNLQDAVEYTLLHPEHLEKERKEVAEEELGISYGNATNNILRIVKNEFTKTQNPLSI